MILALFVLTASNAAATLEPVSELFEIATYNTQSPSYITASVGALDDGGFIVAWTTGSVRNPGLQAALLARRFDKTASPVGTEFVVSSEPDLNSSTGEGYRRYVPDIAATTDGGFVVTWRSIFNSDSGYGATLRASARMFDATGTPVAPDVLVTESDMLSSPVAAAKQDGGFLIVWDAPGSLLHSVHARRYDSRSKPIGTEFEISQGQWPSAIRDARPQAVTGADGSHLVVWQRSKALSGGRRDDDIFARKLDTGGLPIGTEFQVNTYTTGRQGGGTQGTGTSLVLLRAATKGTALAVSALGGFGVSWHDAQRSSIYAAQFHPDGRRRGNEYRVGDATNDVVPPLHETTPQSLVGLAYGWTLAVVGGPTRQVSLFDSRNDPLCAPADIDSDFPRSNSLFYTDAARLMSGDFVVIGPNGGGNVFEHGLSARVYRPSSGAFPDCGDPFQPSKAGSALTRAVSASDALVVLNSAVGADLCPVCVCDVDNSESVTATDALTVLRSAIGQPVSLACRTCP